MNISDLIPLISQFSCWKTIDLFSFQLIHRTYRLMCTSKATPVSRFRGWCSIRMIVSTKVTLIRRRTGKKMRDTQGFNSIDLWKNLFLKLFSKSSFPSPSHAVRVAAPILWSKFCCLYANTHPLIQCGHTMLWHTSFNGLCKHFKPFQLGRWLLRCLWGVLQALLSQLYAGGHAWWPALGIPTPIWVQTNTNVKKKIEWFVHFWAIM